MHERVRAARFQLEARQRAALASDRKYNHSPRGLLRYAIHGVRVNKRRKVERIAQLEGATS